MLRPVIAAKTVLKRSSDDIQLAAEIWGEDAGPNSIAAGPDFSVANPNALPPSPVTPLPMTANYTPSGQRGTPPGYAGSALQLTRRCVEHHIPGYMPASMQQIMPYAVPRLAAGERSATARSRDRGDLVLCARARARARRSS